MKKKQILEWLESENHLHRLWQWNYLVNLIYQK